MRGDAPKKWGRNILSGGKYFVGGVRKYICNYNFMRVPCLSCRRVGDCITVNATDSHLQLKRRKDRLLSVDLHRFAAKLHVKVRTPSTSTLVPCGPLFLHNAPVFSQSK